MPEAGAADGFAVWGHSQGGQAALFTGAIAKSYAPELKLIGVAAAAPASELITLINEDLDSIGGKNIAAMTLWSWARVYGAPRRSNQSGRGDQQNRGPNQFPPNPTTRSLGNAAAKDIVPCESKFQNIVGRRKLDDWR
jgi:hypothetical protein